MKVVVTGASGFLGRALMRALASRRLDAVGVSRRPAPGLVQVADYADAPAGDVLVHLAELNDRRAAAAAGEAYEQEATRTLRALLDKGYGRVVYASSAVLYGDATEAPHAPGDPVHVTDAYTRVKRACELMVLQRGGVAVRLANLYGPGMARGNVLTAILDQIPAPGPIRVLDTGPVRDFLWAEDAALALAAVAAGRATGVFNVGSGTGTSILALAQTALQAAGQPRRTIEATAPAGRPSKILLDIADTQSAFDWAPATPLPAGVRSLLPMQLQGTT